VYRILEGEFVEKRALARSGKRWDYNIKINLGKIDSEDASWMELAQDHVQWWVLVSAVIIHRVLLPKNYLGIS
jgi:hypothetical protein